VLVRSTAVESDMVVGFAVGAAAARFSEGVVDSKAFMIPGVVRAEYSWCHGSDGKSLDSAVMTTWAESSISHGLIRVLVLGH
jgi:hypothetical protein